MVKRTYNVIGMMSGTSLDGVDITYVRFLRQGEVWSFEIVEATTVSYTKEWKERLTNAILLNKEALSALDVVYSDYLGQLCNDFINKYQLVDLDVVCSHGHTIFHKPDLGYTFQLGNLHNLSKWVSTKVVCDFRAQDVALGGQGAPLVPIGDRLLFAEYDACLNLGGFANVSYESEQGKRIAFDLVAVNTVMNEAVKQLGMDFDADGALAKSGVVCQELLDKLNVLEYYEQAAPKSLGIEYVNEVLSPLLQSYRLKTEDLLRTFVEHIAIQINKGIPANVSKVLVTGGGAYNGFLMERIKAHGTADFYVPEAKVIEFKEALIFAFLGALKLEGEINVLSSVTGASKDHSSGVVYN